MPHIQTPQNTWCHCILSFLKYLRFGLKEHHFLKPDNREKKEATFASSSYLQEKKATPKNLLAPKEEAAHSQVPNER